MVVDPSIEEYLLIRYSKLLLASKVINPRLALIAAIDAVRNEYTNTLQIQVALGIQIFWTKTLQSIDPLFSITHARPKPRS